MPTKKNDWRIISADGKKATTFNGTLARAKKEAAVFVGAEDAPGMWLAGEGLERVHVFRSNDSDLVYVWKTDGTPVLPDAVAEELVAVK